MIESFPLAWPVGYSRTKERKQSQFKWTADKSRKDLINQIRMLSDDLDPIISSNVPLRRDGQMYAEVATDKIKDPGVAVYFMYKGKQVTLACDKWETPAENIRALALTIEAMRGLERWGSSDILQRTFTGFKALPEDVHAHTAWWNILDVRKDAGIEEIKLAYRQRAKQYHPDGSQPNIVLFNAVQRAYDQAMQQFQKSTI